MPEIISNYIELHICRKSAGRHKYLILKRSEKNKIYPGIWQMITGGIEIGESTKDAVLRELNEETGITNAKLYVIPRINTFYLAMIDKICMCPVFLAVTESDNVKISDEHSEYKWLGYSEAKELVHWPNQRESIDLIEKYLNDEKLFKKLVAL
jgi:dATP pyrophosphohydrolase